jgi:serine/threonine-protein kinase
LRIPAAGEVLAGKYRLVRVLGEGGMGVVFEAEHLRLRQPIAIKFLNPSMLGMADVVGRFDREARAAATLRSRHVVRVTDVEQTPDGVPYMVMELLEGADLETERERRKRLPYGEVVDYVLQACAALMEAHEAGIVHRDLKPANLFLVRDESERQVVKVLDFGISKFMKGEEAKLTTAGAIMGTTLYMSPEQIRGDAVDARTDIWSLGVILYELIGGDAPWTGALTRVAAAIVTEGAPDLRKTAELPDALWRTIDWMLRKDVRHRPAAVRDVILALSPFVPPGTVGAEVVELVGRKRRGSDPVIVPPTAPAVPERSTMNATTSNVFKPAPRMWGLLAGFGALGVIGLVLMFVATRRPAGPVAAARTGAPAESVLAAPSAPPASASSAPSAIPPTASSSPPPASAAVAATHPAAGVPVHRPVPSPPPVRSGTPKPAGSTVEPAPVNPPFLR